MKLVFTLATFKRVLTLFTFTVLCSCNIWAQSVPVIDTRNDNSQPSNYNKEVKFELKPRIGAGVDAPGDGYWTGMMTFAPWGDASVTDHQLNFNQTGIFYRSGVPGLTWGNWKKLLLENEIGRVGIGMYSPQSKLHIVDGNNNIRLGDFGASIAGIELSDGDYNSYSSVYLLGWSTSFRIATGGNCNNETNHRLVVLDNGNVLIGKTSQFNNTYKLDVTGKIRADEIVVNTSGADFVFEPTYRLRSLSELENFVKTNKHLPDIAPAKEMQEHGVSAGEMQAKLLQKVEELTLYMIDLKKENERIKAEKDKQIGDQQILINEMQKRLDALEKK